MDIEEMIKKWNEQIALHIRVCKDPLMYTKEERLKNSHYSQAICAVVADLKKMTTPAVVGRSEQSVICKKCGGSEMYQYTKRKDKCEDCGNIQEI